MRELRTRRAPIFPVDRDNYWFRDRRAFAVRRRHRCDRRAASGVESPDCASRHRLRSRPSHAAEAPASRPRAQLRRRRQSERRHRPDRGPADQSRSRHRHAQHPGRPAQPGQPLLGGAPFAEIVPVRVANRVVLFSNSAIARAFDYVHGLMPTAANRVDVITMSMGGLASQAWADAVNALYEQGVFIVTAAGNNFGNLPTRNIVYPGALRPRRRRLRRDGGWQALCRPRLRLMAGNYGPDSKMATAIAAPTRRTCRGRGSAAATSSISTAQGTSAATPQVAAAAALWLQKNRAAVDAYPQALDARRGGPQRAVRQRPARATRSASASGAASCARSDALAQSAGRSDACARSRADTASFPFLQHPDRARRRRRRRARSSGCSNSRRCSSRRAADDRSVMPADPATARIAGRAAAACRGAGRAPARVEGAARRPCGAQRRYAGPRAAVRRRQRRRQRGRRSCTSSTP